MLAQQEKHANALPYSTVLLPVSHGYRIDSHVFACIFRKCTTFARRVVVFGPVLVLVCQHRALVLPQYL